MKLKDYQLSLQEKMDEFDAWVTPSLGEISDAESFKLSCEKIKEGFGYLSDLTNGFESVESCGAQNIAERLFNYLKDKDKPQRQLIIESVVNVLFMCTGKTDNNIKCQYPIYLKENLFYIFNDPSTLALKIKLNRVYQFKDVAALFNKLEKIEFKKAILNSYFKVILSTSTFEEQVFSIGCAYIHQKEKNLEDSFLSVLTTFQCRGSITATQGHLPERILRECFVDWGMKADLDYNSDDVDFEALINGSTGKKQKQKNEQKKRKFDFIIPFKTESFASNRILIQSQFYAGDSGSVSHKVVDQTKSSREHVQKIYANPIFMEYLDGAGYYASLNGDLKKMLSNETTKDFFQIKTAPVKLRREIQTIGFLTLLEIEHAVLITDGCIDNVKNQLIQDGYKKEEVERAVDMSIRQDSILMSDGIMSINPIRFDVVRRYLLIDVIANFGQSQTIEREKLCLAVPGYASNWGLPQAELIKIALAEIPSLNKLWTDLAQPFQDIEWLLKKGYICLLKGFV